jgi:hypothetical protein
MTRFRDDAPGAERTRARRATAARHPTLRLALVDAPIALEDAADTAATISHAHDDGALPLQSATNSP